VARQKDNENDVLWGEFLWVVIICEYNVAYCWPFSGIDAHPPHAINQTDFTDTQTALRLFSVSGFFSSFSVSVISLRLSFSVLGLLSVSQPSVS